MKVRIVRALESTCTLIDTRAPWIYGTMYRLTRYSGVIPTCPLGHLAFKLQERWGLNDAIWEK